jgi:hypothetical protein
MHHDEVAFDAFPVATVQRSRGQSSWWISWTGKTNHQIDVYWEFTKAGITYRTVVQAKNWSRPLDQGEVFKFEAVLRDLPGQPRGIMVAANGYQSGARETAAACGIAVYELNPEPEPPRITLTNTGWARFELKGYPFSPPPTCGFWSRKRGLLGLLRSVRGAALEQIEPSVTLLAGSILRVRRPRA